MPEDFFSPLPRGSLSDVPVTSGKFYNIEVYGTIFAEGGTISGDFDISGDLTVTGDMDIAGDMYSNNWDGASPLPDASATTGWAMDGSAGTAQFQSIYAKGGELGDLDVTGLLTMSSSGKIRTASSGERIEISTTNASWLQFFTGASGESSGREPRLTVDTEGSSGTLRSTLWLTAGALDTNSKAASMVIQSAEADESDASRIVIQKTTVGTGGTVAEPFIQSSLDFYQTGFIYMSGDNTDLTMSGDNSDLRFTGTTNQYVKKEGTGGLFIQNTTSSGDTLLQNDDSGGNVRTRIRIYGHGNTDFYDRTGTFRARVSTAGFAVAAGSAGVPSFYNVDDNDTGIYFPTTAQFAITIAGTQEFLLGATGLVIPNVYSLGISGTTRDVYVKDDGTVSYLTSRRDTKTDIRYAKELEDVELNPVLFEYKETAEPDAGFIVEDLAEQHPLLAVYDDGEPVSYNAKPILAVLAAKVNRLEEQMARCNCAV